MEIDYSNSILQLGSFATITLGIIVLFIGKRLNDAIDILREFNIPEPVTGGLFFSVFITLLYVTAGIEIEFNLGSRDFLLVYFFTIIGINSSLRDLINGGKPLFILLMITIIYMIIQNITGITIALLFDLPSQIGLLAGTVSLIGGHGTAIAWAPRIMEEFNISNAMEVGVASATFGLILASVMGGPIAKFLITRHNLKPLKVEGSNMEISGRINNAGIGHFDILDAILAIHITIILGFLINESLERIGLSLPLFVTCLFAGIIISNLVPKSFPRITGTEWPSRKPAIALISDISLGTFLVMSLMSMQLWTLSDLAGPMITLLISQFIIAFLVTIFVVFPLMGRTYDAAVISAGFGGISLGSTPTAMANMAAVENRYGPSVLAFVIVPLVCAFFIDLINAFLIPFFLANF